MKSLILLFFNGSLEKGLQWTVRTVFAWKVNMALYVSLMYVIKRRSLVMEKASMRSLKSILKTPAALFSLAVSLYSCF